MSQFRYEVMPSDYRDESSFHSPDKSMHNTRIQLFFIRDLEEDELWMADEEGKTDMRAFVTFTYYGEKPGLPSPEEAVRFLKQACRTIVEPWKHCRRGNHGYMPPALGMLSGNFNDMDEDDVQNFITCTAPAYPNAIPVTQVVDFVHDYKYRYYSACKLIDSMGEGGSFMSNSDFDIFKTEDEFLEWMYEEETDEKD